MELPTTTSELSPLMQKLTSEKKVAREFSERRHLDWNENYELYRNKVKTNRLTQRQAVNIPLMKETIKTLLSKIDDPPLITFKEKGGDRYKELVLQEKWDTDFERLNVEGIDVQDKKTVLLYGRGWKKLNFVEKQFDINALDIFDVVVDPLVNPLDIETARFLVHQNIFRSLRDILADKRYTTEGKQELKTYLTTSGVVVQSAENKQELEKKLERMNAMGQDKNDFDTFGAGDTIVNLSEHYTLLWNTTKQKFERYVCTYADNKVLLLKEKLTNLLGVDFLPFVSWGEDIETQDIWSDGPGDLVRTPNKVLNVWFSQKIENRTLQNFQMYWYDATAQGFIPQTYEPGPGRMLPAPGEPSKTIMPVQISGLEDTITMIEFVIKLVESGTAATAIEKGVSEKKQITLGEVEMLVGKATERTISMAKFYRRAWKELARKWYAILDANTSKGSKETLYKVSSKGKVWPKVVYGKDWKSEKGYRIDVASSSEQESEKTKGIQRWMFIQSQFPENPAVAKIAQRRILEIGDITPEEMREVEEFEKKKLEQPVAQSPIQPQPIGEQPMRPEELQTRLNELKNLSATI
mgnify:CR=1 FL=1